MAARRPSRTLSTPRNSGKQTQGKPINKGATAYGPGALPGPAKPGTSSTPTGPKANWQSPKGAHGKNVIPRNTPNSAHRNNLWINGGLDG